MNIKDFKWTEKRFGTTFANILKKLGGLSKDGTDGSIEYKDDQGNVTKLVTDSNFSSLLAKNGLIEVKWQELKDKRDSGKLIPGSLYRITDYNCTTTQENTRSAGHQFDIVLLALSENKLAEEGWAMMNESNVYDVTFSDGVTKKCWIYKLNDTDCNIVDVDTLLGIDTEELRAVSIDETNKTAIDIASDSGLLETPNLPYNYFQNSNLSAWKVWYCLDNDKSRFAWATTPVSAVYSLTINSGGYEVSCTAFRDESRDSGEFKCFVLRVMTSKTYGWIKSETTSVGTVTIYLEPSENAQTTQLIITSVTELPPVKATGVIYRLIDEFNNDIKYDFKNIQLAIPLTDGVYDEKQGVLTFVYTLTAFDKDRGDYIDISLSRAWGCKIGYSYNEQMNIYGLSPCFCFNNASQIEIGNNCFAIVLNDCANVSIGSDSSEVILTSIYKSSFGKQSENIRDLTPDRNCLNYGNGGVELATKDDLN